VFSAGFDAPVVARTTLVVDLMGRRAPNAMAFQSGTTVFPSRGPGPLPSAAFTARNDFGLGDPRTITQVLGSVGARFDLGRATYANVSVLFPTSNEGLRPLTAAVFSIARGF
jgi:hypothetical protein